MRQLFIGDIQGCFDELMDLLEKLNYDEGQDELFLVGDVINRGPKSREVLDYLFEHKAIRTVMGNHEHYFLKAVEAGNVEDAFPLTYPFLKDRLDDFLPWLKSWPYWIECEDWLLVHAGVLPAQPFQDTDPEILCTIRHLPEPDKRPWYEALKSDRYTIFGHWAKKGIVRHGMTRGLDSGCVYGGELSALILPEDRIVSVPAREKYFEPIEKRALWMKS